MPKSAPSPKLCIRPVKKIADLSSTTCYDDTSEIDMPTPVSNINSLSRMETETDIHSVPLSANDTSTDIVSPSAPSVVRSTNCAVDEVNWSSEAAAAELLKLALPHINTDRYIFETETRQSPSRSLVPDAKDKETKGTQPKKRKRNKPTPTQKRLSSSTYPSHSNTTPHSGHDDVNGFLRYLADALSNMSSHVDQSFAKLREDLAFRLNEFESRYVDRILMLESEIEKLKNPDTHLNESHDPIISPEPNLCDKDSTFKTTLQHKLSTTHLEPGYFDKSNHLHLNEQKSESVPSFSARDYPEAVTVAAEVLSELKTGSLSAQTLSTSEAYRPPLPQLPPLERPSIPIDATTATAPVTVDRRQPIYEPPVETNQRSTLYSTSSLPVLERQEYKFEYNYSSSHHPDSQSYHYNLPPPTDRYKSNFSFTSPSPPPASKSNYYSSQCNREQSQLNTSTSFYPSSTLNSSSSRYNSYPDPLTLPPPREPSPSTKPSTYINNNDYDSRYNYTHNNDYHTSYPRSNDYPYPKHSDHNDRYYNHNDPYRDEYKRYKPYSYSPNERHRNEGTNNGLNRSIPNLKLDTTNHRDQGFPYREGHVPV